MTTTKRRIILALGAAFLVGGWGAIQYPAMFAEAGVELTKFVHVWDGAAEAVIWSLKWVFVGGVVAMALGAGLIGFGVLRSDQQAG